ncbi:MAG: TonB-dependent receptor, partial [Glaciimonas sp.]|nr:TonB-dependent receptor [Glaciimonas sp.]
MQKLFLQDAVALTNQFSVVAGLAYDHVKRNGSDYGSLDKTNSQNIQTTKTYSELLPSLGLKYQIDPANHAFYNVTHTFRAPQNYTLYDYTALPNGTLARKADQQPETAWSHEFGWRYVTPNTSLAATVFYTDFKNRQASMTNIDGITFNYNAGTVKNTGIELEGSYALTKTLNVHAAYTFTSSKQQDDFLTNGVLLPTKDKQFGNIPRQMLNASVGYDDRRFFSGLTGKYTGSIYGDLTNDQKIGGYTLFDVNAGYRFEKIGFMKGASITLAGLNVFNKSYLASVDSVTTNSIAYGKVNGSAPYYIVGGARAVSLTLAGS